MKLISILNADQIFDKTDYNDTLLSRFFLVEDTIMNTTQGVVTR